MFDRRTEADAEVLDEVHAGTGAVVMGKRMVDVGVGPCGEPPPFRKPVFVVTHEPGEPLSKQGGTTYIFAGDGIEAALEQARAASNIFQQYLRAGLLDELQIHLGAAIVAS